MADEGRTTVVETRGGGSAGIVIAIIALIAVVVIGYFVVMNQNSQTNAVTGAAQSVGQAADKVGDAATPKSN